MYKFLFHSKIRVIKLSTLKKIYISVKLKISKVIEISIFISAIIIFAACQEEKQENKFLKT